ERLRDAMPAVLSAPLPRASRVLPRGSGRGKVVEPPGSRVHGAPRNTIRMAKRTTSPGTPDGGKKPLVIVESPAKAKTIGRFLGKDYLIEASIGHVRDLPSNASEIPESLRKEPWARLGIDVEHDFKPLYVVP